MKRPQITEKQAEAFLCQFFAAYWWDSDTEEKWKEKMRGNVLAALEAAEQAAWEPVSALPRDGLVLAETDDGRTMIWDAKILAGCVDRTTSGKQPLHLQFPATRWRRIPSSGSPNGES